jgi:cytochrome c
MRWSFAAGVMLLLAGNPVAAQDAVALEKRGEELAARHCSMCHAIGRTGMSPHAEAVLFRTLSRKYPVESLEEALAEGMVAGHPDMPEVKLSAGDVGAFIAYLNAIQER